MNGRWSHVCTDGNLQWCKFGERCGICLKEEDDSLGHHGPKDRDRVGPGAVPRTIADTIKSLKPGDRVRVTFEDEVHMQYSGGIALISADVNEDVITSIEVIERPLQVGDRVEMLDDPKSKGRIRAIDDGEAWIKWEHPCSWSVFQLPKDLRKAS